MWTLLNPKTWIAAALAAVLAVSHFSAYRAGSASVRQKWDAQITMQALATAKASEDARIKEQALQIKVTKVQNDYIAEKNKRAADNMRSAGVLREYRDALARVAAKDTSAPSGVVGALATIAGECAGAFAEMDKAARQYRGTAVALQDFTRSVCVAP